MPTGCPTTAAAGAASPCPGSGRARVELGAIGGGLHRLVSTASDYQETKNNENVLRILPNTRTFRGTFTVP